MQLTDSPFLVFAAGGIIFRVNGSDHEVLLVHRNRYNDISLPKGKMQPGESFEETAIREIFEETGFQVSISGLADIHIRKLDAKMKITVFYKMILKGEMASALNSDGGNEVKEIIWVPLHEVMKKISYPEQGDLIHKTFENETHI